MKLEMLGMTDQHTMSVIVVCGLKLEIIAKGFSSTQQKQVLLLLQHIGFGERHTRILQRQPEQ